MDGIVCYQKDKQSKIDINDVELTEIIFNNYQKYDVYSDFINLILIL